MKDEVLEYCNSSDVNIPLIETSAKVGYTVTRWNDYRSRRLRMFFSVRQHVNPLIVISGRWSQVH